MSSWCSVSVRGKREKRNCKTLYQTHIICINVKLSFSKALVTTIGICENGTFLFVSQHLYECIPYFIGVQSGRGTRSFVDGLNPPHSWVLSFFIIRWYFTQSRKILITYLEHPHNLPYPSLALFYRLICLSVRLHVRCPYVCMSHTTFGTVLR